MAKSSYAQAIKSAHADAPVEFRATRRDVSRLSPQARLELPPTTVEAFYRPPEPHEVVVVWPKRAGRHPDLPCKFVTKAPRRGDYMYLRWPTDDRDNPYWCVKLRPARGPTKDGRWSTKCGLDELADAIEQYIALFARLIDEHINGVSPGARVAAEVLTEFVTEQAKRKGHGEGKITDETFVNVTDAIKRLYPYIDGWRVDQFEEGFSRNFMVWAKQPAPEGRGLAHNTARASVGVLRFALESMLRKGRYMAPFPIPPEEKVVINIFAAGEMARVPIAAETGRIWDRETNDWQREVDPVTGELRYATRRPEVARAALPYGRFFQLGWIFGDRRSNYQRLTWSGTDNTPWIDLENGVYHGLGAADRKSSKLSGDREIPEAHKPMLRQWRDADWAAGVDFVLHGWDGRPVRNFCYQVWYGLLEAAGAQALHPHCLKHTCVTMLRTAGVPRIAAAAYLSTWPNSLDKYYGKFDAPVRRPAVEALGSLDHYAHWWKDRLDGAATIAAAQALAGMANDNRAA
jgi:integrase